MPTIYLSPSTQEFNTYVNGGTEEQYMNLVADAMEPYLRSSGIQFTRNTPEMTAASSIRQSNEGNYDAHIALHSNAAPTEAEPGSVQGLEVYYYPTSVEGKRLAEIMADTLRDIYPNPSLVKIVPSTYLGEVRLTKAPSILIEYAYHDNEMDANWIKDNINKIAAYTVLGITRFFDIPFVAPMEPQSGLVTLTSGNLNIREKPSLDAPIINQVPNGDFLTVLGEWQDWYVVQYNGQDGYAYAKYITLQ